MKNILAATLAVLALSSFAHAMEEDHYRCATPDGKIQVQIDAPNRSDVDLASYDSVVASEEESPVKLTAQVDGQNTDAILKLTSATDGQAVEETKTTKEGKTCLVGLSTKDIQVHGRIYLGGIGQSVALNCAGDTKVSEDEADCQ